MMFYYVKLNVEYFGFVKGKNIIKIYLESFQLFLIDYKLNGEEVMLFLNKFVYGGEDVMYFDNFFYQIGQGKIFDVELIMDNFIFGFFEGFVFVIKGENIYQLFFVILDQKEGYISVVLYGDYKLFWNCDQIYKYIGYDKFFDVSSYDMLDENIVNMGFKDKLFFIELILKFEFFKQLFYVYLIMLINYYLFNLDEEDVFIKKVIIGDKIVDNYFQIVCYFDEVFE